MGLYRVHLSGHMSRWLHVLAAPYVLVGLLVDCAANATLFALLFLELPREWLVTQRLQRHLRTGSGWRYRVARAICVKLLDVFDPTGAHCD